MARHDLIDQLGLRPHIEGSVSGVPDERIVELYAEAEMAVVPSLYEGFSLPPSRRCRRASAWSPPTEARSPRYRSRRRDGAAMQGRRCRRARLGAIRRGLDDPELRRPCGEDGSPSSRRAVELEALRTS